MSDKVHVHCFRYTHVICLFFKDIYGPNYNYLFQNEWCEVSILPVVRERAEVPLFTMEESPCQVSELWVNQLTNDWRVLSGIDTGAQGWGQQSGRTGGHVRLVKLCGYGTKTIN